VILSRNLLRYGYVSVICGSVFTTPLRM